MLPWLRVAGRNRNGLKSAELLVSLTDVGGPDGLRVLGVIWYVGAFVGLLTWGAIAVAARPWHHLSARTGAVVAVAAWATFTAWAWLYDLVLIRWPGPLIGLGSLTMLSWLAYASVRE